MKEFWQCDRCKKLTEKRNSPPYTPNVWVFRKEGIVYGTDDLGNPPWALCHGCNNAVITLLRTPPTEVSK